MFAVLLVDDEDTIVNTLKNELPWQEMGVDHVFTASNGVEALEVSAQQPIALVIADIRMPEMDGLTMVEKMRAQSPRTHYILLTAHSEFEYARAAISLGVENYLLKPIAMDELEQTVRRAVSNIYAKRNGHWLNYSNSILSWMTGTIEFDELVERAMYHNINLYLPQYAVVCFTKKDHTPLSAFCESCMSILLKQFSVYYCQDENGRHFMIIGGREIDPGKVVAVLREHAIEQGMENKLGIAVGSPVTESLELVQSYLSACKNADLKATLGNDVPFVHQQETGAFVTYEDLQLMLYQMNSHNAAAAIQQYAVRVHTNGSVSLMTLLQNCTHILLTEYPNSEDQLRQAVQPLKSELNEMAKTKGFQAAVIQLLTKIWQIFEQEWLKLNPSVRLALGYIRAEYASGVSIREFCNRYSMNPAYLGYLFKRECGVFFNEYLMRVRILQAGLLLRSTDLKIQDVTVQTGFSSPSYFIKCFKSATGLSPAKYRLERYQAGAGDVQE